MIPTASIRSLKSDLQNTLRKRSGKIVFLLKKYVTEILNFNGKKWIDIVDPKIKNDTIEIFNLTKKLKPEYSSTIDSILSTLNEIIFVYDKNGKWVELNKLNTNKSDLPIFISDLVALFPKYDISKMIDEIEGDNFNMLMSCINEAVKDPEFVWNKLLYKPEKYIQHIKKFSKEGEILENKIKDEYIKDGWEIIHQGGDGNIIDMLLGVDLIVKKGAKYLYLQIKKISSINDVEIENQRYVEVKGDTYLSNYMFIDAVIYCTKEGKKIGAKNQIYYVKRKGKLITEKGVPCPSNVNDNTIYLKK